MVSIEWHFIYGCYASIDQTMYLQNKIETLH